MSRAARPAARRHAVALLALLGLWVALTASAGLSILWRAAVLSWDDPVTQLQDEVASQGVLDAHAFRRALEHVTAARQPAGRLLLPPGGARGDQAARGSHLSRSPPAR